MSDNPKPLNVREQAERLLGDGTDLAGKSDMEIKRLVVRELLDRDDADLPDTFIDGAFAVFADGDPPAFAQARRAQHKKELDQLRDTDIQGELN